MSMPLNTYEEWRECIEVHCGIPLTTAFVRERLAELKDRGHPKTKEFRRLYGEKHLERTIGWFEQAAKDTGAS